ncbi:predicted protein [Phaeodactylum tricornutum CCAP 1055/1]|uniref:Uncharacterized protein n=2 Tax=Phaeodactylum tricornutum TaxID=2850 RepID=B5Y4F9_PHATC|nr:predicted protein [Phaeodactylum tricornutum CCAP 1055/1]ACI65474.1 predicted protein [Phaeodactylum tricornutum CCAP 1055/1]|eukprot:XP_002186004.1 predicted protein [Phaeodactylum tricornutum CCAP 1055/1]
MYTMRACMSIFVLATIALSSIGILVSMDVVLNMQSFEDKASLLHASSLPDRRSSKYGQSDTGIQNIAIEQDISAEQYPIRRASSSLPGRNFQNLSVAPETLFRKPFWSNSSSFDIDAPTILVQLGGELANQLGYIARASGLVWWLEREYGVNANVVLRRQESTTTKWIRARTDVTRCFPYLRDLDFEAGYTDEITHEISFLKEPGLQSNSTSARLIEARREGEYDETLQSFLSLYAQNHTNMGKRNGFLMTSKDLIVDKYYEDIRRIYQFDESCCIDVPDTDESVFHFRNFVTEGARIGNRLNFKELAPDQVANELFAHLNPGDKVAITSRYPDDFRTRMIVEAFEKRNIRVRVVGPRSGVADFCFLMHAQKELVGTAMSSFLIWAGLLGNATKVRAYTAMMSTGNSIFNHYNYTHPELKSRFRFERYAANMSASDLVLSKKQNTP